MPTLADFRLNPDLRTDVVPIHRAASSLAALIKRATAERTVITITQKGYPTAVLLSTELFTLLQGLAAAAGEAPEGSIRSESGGRVTFVTITSAMVTPATTSADRQFDRISTIL